MRCLCRVLIALMLLALPTLVRAQAPAAPPPAPLTQQQFDGLVDQIAKAVAQRLKEDAAKPASAAPAHPAAGAASPMATVGMDSETDRAFIAFIGQARQVVMAFPDLLANLARIPSFFEDSMNEGRSPWAFFVLLAIAAIAAVGVETALRWAVAPLQQRLAAHIHGPQGLWRLAGIACFDALALAMVWLVSYGFVVVWFQGVTPQARFAYLVLTGIFAWRLFMVGFRIALRPALAAARLASIDDADAKAIYRRISAVVVLTLILMDVVRILSAIDTPPHAVALADIFNAIIVPGAFIWAAVSVREPVARWFLGLSRAGQPGRVPAALAEHWLVIAVPYFVALGLARAYGSIAAQAAIPNAVILTMEILIGLLLLETLLDRAGRLLGRDPDDTVGSTRQRIVEILVRCLRVAVLIAAVGGLAGIWLVDAIGVMDKSGYRSMQAPFLAAGITLLAAYCAWQFVKFLTDTYTVASRPVVPGHPDDGGGGAGGSRLGTLMPLLRVAALVVICIVAVLTALSQLGVNITPLIAGASIAGLAISFGSQTLVRDIVSGVFYLVDDAFRVGEYIDCGKAKGTVEGFTLRSIKLRHQNGPVHTIPFGQLGQITNFSRDWATLKFNLRFARNTDLEKLRKLVKKIGQDMLEDPEMKDEFLVPLKMQGVADVIDSALICRFKFTVKPSKPTFIQREAIKRMIRQLPEAGIEFANATVAVQTLGGSAEQAAAAAAASSALAKAAAERAAAAAG